MKKLKKNLSRKSFRVADRKRVTYYLKIYFLTILIGIITLAGEYYLFPPQHPCANSGSCQSDLSEKIENGASGIFEGRTVIPPHIDLAQDKRDFKVLGANTNPGEKHIYVDLSSQTLYTFEGVSKVFQTLVSTGRWNKTPVGNFHIWEKLRSTRMKGGEGDDAYDLPNVPWVMYFYGDFGLHGAYWHDNFGYTMSHGCVNLRQIDAETLYHWADGPSGKQLGTAVSICDQFAEPNICIQKNPIH